MLWKKKESSYNGNDIKIKSLRCDRQQILISNFTVILVHSKLSQFIFHGFQFNFDGLINSYHFIAHCVCASSSWSERTCNKFNSHHTQASIFYYTISCSQAWYIKHNSDRLDVWNYNQLPMGLIYISYKQSTCISAQL